MVDIKIPDEVVEALRENIHHDCSLKHAIAAALAAWPGMEQRSATELWVGGGPVAIPAHIHLPLPGGDA